MSLHVDRSGTGPDLVLLHGWGLHSGAWTEVLPTLAARARVHAIDLPGHGRSAGVAASSFDAATDAVAALVPEGATLCGWSLGGLIAQRLVHRHPGRVARLALVATTPCFMQRPGWPSGVKPAVLQGFAEALARDRDVMLKRFVALNALHGAQEREAVRAFTRRLAERGARPCGGASSARAGRRSSAPTPNACRSQPPARSWRSPTSRCSGAIRTRSSPRWRACSSRTGSGSSPPSVPIR